MLSKEVDMVILSWAKDDALKEITERGIRSCIESDPSVQFNFYVVESNPSVAYDVTTIHPETDFGYHKFMNIGVREGDAKYVCLCNNDLTYETGWATEIINVMESQPYIQSASPWCPQTQGSNEEHKDKLYAGYGVRNEVAGWCIFQQRSIYEHIGELCEDVEFWFSDNLYAEQIKLNKIPHVLVANSVVNHHDGILGKTASTIDEETKQKYMMGQEEKYKQSITKLKNKVK